MGEGRSIRRRDFVKGLAVAGVAAAGVATGASAISLIPLPTDLPMTPGLFGFEYTAGPQQQGSWFASLVGKPVRASDFPVDSGATCDWVGVPALKACWVFYLDANAPHRLPGGEEIGFEAPPEAEVVEYGRGVFVGIYGGCTHACCVPGFREAYPELDILHCTCHNSRFNPYRLEWAKDATGTRYIGTQLLASPAPRGLPYIPLVLESDRLMGRVSDENIAWYRYCGMQRKEAR